MSLDKNATVYGDPPQSPAFAHIPSRDAKPTAATDYALAFADQLQHFADMLRDGAAPSDHGAMVELIGRAMAHRT